MKKYSLIILFLVLFLGLHLATKITHAQQKAGLDVTISPTILELTESPGKKIHGTFRIRNNSSSPITLRLHIDKLTNTEHGTIAPKSPQKEDSYASWLTFEKETLTAPPKEWTTIAYTIDIPETAAFGYYYAIRIGSEQNKETATTKVIGEVIIPLLLTVQKDGAVREATITEFKTKQTINQYVPVAFLTTIANKGNVHVKPRGNIFIRGNGEKDIAILEVNEGMGSVLPNTKRSFETNWTDGFLVQESVLLDGTEQLDEKGKPRTHLVVHWNKLTDFRIGKYTATLLMVYDNGKRDVALEGITSFWVIPYTAIIVALVVLIVLFFVIRFFLKRYVQSQIKKYQNKR